MGQTACKLEADQSTGSVLWTLRNLSFLWVRVHTVTRRRFSGTASCWFRRFWHQTNLKKKKKDNNNSIYSLIHINSSRTEVHPPNTVTQTDRLWRSLYFRRYFLIFAGRVPHWHFLCSSTPSTCHSSFHRTSASEGHRAQLKQAPSFKVQLRWKMALWTYLPTCKIMTKKI